MGLFSKRKDVAELKANREFGELAKVMKKDEDQRDAAAQALIELGDVKAVRALADVADDITFGSSDTAAAHEVMRGLGPEMVLDPITEWIKEGDYGAANLIDAFEPDLVAPRLKQVLEAKADVHPSVLGGASTPRALALDRLVKIGTPEALTIVRRALEGQAYPQALVAVKRDWDGGEPEIVRAVLAPLRRDPDDETVETVAQILNKLMKRILKDKEIADSALPALAGAMRDDESVQVRRVAAHIVSEVYDQGPSEWHKHDPRTTDALAAALEDSDQQVRWYAAFGLAYQNDNRGTPQLCEMIESGDKRFVYSGLKGIEMTDDLAALPAVRRLDKHMRGVDGAITGGLLGIVKTQLERAEEKRVTREGGYDPPGWYPDPGDPRKERYWAGGEWTDRRRERATG